MPGTRGPQLNTIPADRLRDLRSEAGLSTKQLEARAHVAHSTISYMEKVQRGDKNKVAALAREIGNAIGKPLTAEDMSWEGMRAKEARAAAKDMPPVRAGMEYTYPSVPVPVTPEEADEPVVVRAAPHGEPDAPAEPAPIHEFEIGERLHQAINRVLDIVEAVVTTPR